MWTITFTRNSKEYTASFTSNSEFQTDSPSLEAMYLIKLDNPPILQATATGPSAELDLTVPHLVYVYVGGILFNDLDVKEWDTEGDYLWPLDKTAPGAVFNSQKYVDYIQNKRMAEFYNKCHSAEDGTFCKTPGEPGHEGHAALPAGLKYGKRYTQAEMIAVGADGFLSNATLLSIPLLKIDGREPVPSASEGNEYEKGRPITQPIEVVYQPDNDVYMLYGGNHRVHQAEINGQTEIPAFVEREQA